LEDDDDNNNNPQLRGSKPPFSYYYHYSINGCNLKVRPKPLLERLSTMQRKYAAFLDTGDASPLLTLSPRNKQHALKLWQTLQNTQGDMIVYADKTAL
jgi:hypothetical protein